MPQAADDDSNDDEDDGTRTQQSVNTSYTCSLTKLLQVYTDVIKKWRLSIGRLRAASRISENCK